MKGERERKKWRRREKFKKVEIEIDRQTFTTNSLSGQHITPGQQHMDV